MPATPARLVADVHGAVAALRKVAGEPGPLLVLGDLVNFIDYRNLDGLLTDMIGRELVAEMVRLRTLGDYSSAGEIWRSHIAGREEEFRLRWHDLMSDAYTDICGALTGSEAYVTYGNVDHPGMLRAHLPAGARFVDAEVVELGGVSFGFAGGGTKSPLGVPGEVSDDEMTAKLEAIGAVDVLCTHVPPAIPALAEDTIGGRTKGSRAVLDYLVRHQPAIHYFGDIHQPQATTWRVGRTRCHNVGYFRATGRPVVFGGP